MPAGDRFREAWPASKKSEFFYGRVYEGFIIHTVDRILYFRVRQ